MLFVRRNPVGRNLMLGGRQINFAGADFGVQLVFQLVFDVSVPRLGPIRLRP